MSVQSTQIAPTPDLFPSVFINRRLDEWVRLEQLDLDSVEKMSYENLKYKVTGLKMTRHQKRKIDETHVEGHEELDPASLREHEEFTKVKNIATIELGRYQIETWYFSPFPPEYNDSSNLYFCEFCLNFMKRKEQLQRHMVSYALFSSIYLMKF
ncbi:histone acetyltransferase of the MYST family protein [Tanacetum coccineum]